MALPIRAFSIAGGFIMAWMKRIVLFVLVNILVIITISLTLNILGIRPYIEANGIDYSNLLAFCAVVGFSGALISLALSRFMAKMMMGVRVINSQSPRTGAEQDLLHLVSRLSQRAGLAAMPEVGVYDSPEVNAFATGPTKSRSLVAVSTGLLDQLDSQAVEGVLGHEIAHIANGDMVTMTLVQGVVNTFVMFFARIAAWVVAQAFASKSDREESPSPMIHFVAVMVFEILFSILGAIVVCFFSRWREFRADKGGAQVAGREKMIHALESLSRTRELIDPSHPAMASLKISGKTKGFFSLFATHPDLESRIAALRGAA
jgi:heat shock protein HtpX